MSHYFSSDIDPSGSDRKEKQITLRGNPYTVFTDRGVFSGNKVDPGTKVLLELVPDPSQVSTALDIGCGWGPITIALAHALPDARVLGVDVNPLAVSLTNENLAKNNFPHASAHEVDSLLAAEPSLTFDLMWSNPPIRVGKAALHQIMETWLPRLSPTGVAYLVANKNLGGDSLHKWIGSSLGFSCTRIGSRQGFRVLEVRRG